MAARRRRSALRVSPRKRREPPEHGTEQAKPKEDKPKTTKESSA